MFWLLLAAAWAACAVVAWRASPGWRHTVLVLGASLAGFVCLGLWIVSRLGLGTHGGTVRHAAPCSPVPVAPGSRDWVLREADGMEVRGVLHPSRASVGLVILPSWPSGPRGLAVDTVARWWSPRARVLVLAPQGAPGGPGVQGPGAEDAVAVLLAAGWLREQGVSEVVALGEGDGALSVARAALRRPGALNAVVLAGPSRTWGEPRPEEPWWRDPAGWPGRLAWAVVAGWRFAAPGPGDGETLMSLVPRLAPLPVLMLGGREDADPSLREAYALAGEPKGLRLLPGKGRPLPWSGYEAYHQTVSDWLRRLYSQQGSTSSSSVDDRSGRGVPEAPDSVLSPMGPTKATMSVAQGEPASQRAARDLARLLEDPQPILPPMATHPPDASASIALPPARAAQPGFIPVRARPTVRQGASHVPAPPRLPPGGRVGFQWPTLPPAAPVRAPAMITSPAATAIIEWDEERQGGGATSSFSR